MDKDTALKLALKALRFAGDDGYQNEVSQQAITAIKQALAAPSYVKTFHGGKPWPLQPAPVQEPVGYDYRTKYDRGCYKCLSQFCPGNCINTTPPVAEWQKIECPICGDMAVATDIPAAQRQWVGLTDEVKRELIKNSALWDMHIHIGWYSAPAKSFAEKTIQLIADIEAKLKEKNT